MTIGTRSSCMIKKTGDEKSRDTVPLVLSFSLLICLLHLVWFHLKVYGNPYTRTYTEFLGFSRYCAVKNSAEFRGITRNKVNCV
jgi:hypothetical protein